VGETQQIRMNTVRVLLTTAPMITCWLLAVAPGRFSCWVAAVVPVVV
jgi:hypothetical protein